VIDRQKGFQPLVECGHRWEEAAHCGASGPVGVDQEYAVVHVLSLRAGLALCDDLLDEGDDLIGQLVTTLLFMHAQRPDLKLVELGMRNDDRFLL
jgi:hypothetical protein